MTWCVASNRYPTIYSPSSVSPDNITLPMYSARCSLHTMSRASQQVFSPARTHFPCSFHQISRHYCGPPPPSTPRHARFTAVGVRRVWLRAWSAKRITAFTTSRPTPRQLALPSFYALKIAQSVRYGGVCLTA